MGDGQRNTLHARTPIFYEPWPSARRRVVTGGEVLDPRRLGPLHPRVFVCDIVFRLKDRYYIGNPKGQSKGSKRYSVLLHRVVYEAVYGPIPEGYEVHHRDDDTFNNHAGNLEAVPRFAHRSVHKSEPRHVCICRVCGREFGCYHPFGARCSPACKRADHARYERDRRACIPGL